MEKLFQDAYRGVRIKSGHCRPPVTHSLMCKALKDRRAHTDEIHKVGTSSFPATNLC